MIACCNQTARKECSDQFPCTFRVADLPFGARFFSYRDVEGLFRDRNHRVVSRRPKFLQLQCLFKALVLSLEGLDFFFWILLCQTLPFLGAWSQREHQRTHPSVHSQGFLYPKMAQEFLEEVERKLNERPRKRHVFLTPNQVLSKLTGLDARVFV